jgi:hypothetical protein
VIPTYRRFFALLSGLTLTTATLVTAGISAPDTTPDTQPVFADSCIGYCKHPTNAGKVFRWGVEKWRQEFEKGRLSSHWQSDHPDSIGQQQGMLTIQAASDSGTVKVWPDNRGAVYGRWEARVRAVEKSDEGEPYQFTWQLVPVDGDDSCGANTIVLATYVPGDKRVTGAVRTLPDNSFEYSRKRDLRSRAWHTYAVEVTADHISWFVDTKVIRTETRPEALSGVTYRPQFALEGDAETEMRPSWMQMDWVRHYTLKRPNAKSIEAPQMAQTTYTSTCTS